MKRSLLTEETVVRRGGQDKRKQGIKQREGLCCREKIRKKEEGEITGLWRGLAGQCQRKEDHDNENREKKLQVNCLTNPKWRRLGMFKG